MKTASTIVDRIQVKGLKWFAHLLPVPMQMAEEIVFIETNRTTKRGGDGDIME